MSSHLEYADALLACIGSTAVSDETLDRLNVDTWHALPPFLQFHGITPYAYLYLKRVGKLSKAPTDVQHMLASEYERNAARNMVVFAELNRILVACHACAIPVIPLKGAYLARSIYPDPACRVLGDIDIQVRQEDGQRVAEVLRVAGYASKWNGDSEWKKQAVHLPGFIKAGALCVEVHLQFTSPFTDFCIDDEKIWKRAHQDEGNVSGCMAMSSEDLFLFLCNHIYRTHFRVGLRHLLDLRELLDRRGDELNMIELQVRAREWKMERMLSVALTSLDILFHCKPSGEKLSFASELVLPHSLQEGLRVRIFREDSVYGASVLLRWIMKHIKLIGCWNRQGPSIARLKDRKGSCSIRKRLSDTAVVCIAHAARFVKDPRQQLIGIGRRYRELQFERWMKWL